MKRRLLILGGTREAAALAHACTDGLSDRLSVISSLAGRLPTIPALPGEIRVGGFGGHTGLVDYLESDGIDFVIDATHPFAAAISRHAAGACEICRLPRLRLARPPWTPQPGDHWIEVDDLSMAAETVGDVAKRAFLATGANSLAPFAAASDVWFLVRLFASPASPLPLAAHQVIVARPPFTIEGETGLLRDHRIEAVVTKQSGGTTDAKLAAARALGLPVIMVKRPAEPEGERVETVDAAVDWLETQLASVA